MQCKAIQYHTIHYNILQYNRSLKTQIPVFWNTMQYNTIQHYTTEYNTIQSNTNLKTQIPVFWNAMQRNAMQCNAMQSHTIQPNTIQHNTIPYYTIYGRVPNRFVCQIGSCAKKGDQVDKKTAQVGTKARSYSRAPRRSEIFQAEAAPISRSTARMNPTKNQFGVQGTSKDTIRH